MDSVQTSRVRANLSLGKFSNFETLNKVTINVIVSGAVFLCRFVSALQALAASVIGFKVALTSTDIMQDR